MRGCTACRPSLRSPARRGGGARAPLRGRAQPVAGSGGLYLPVDGGRNLVQAAQDDGAFQRWQHRQPRPSTALGWRLRVDVRGRDRGPVDSPTLSERRIWCPPISRSPTTVSKRRRTSASAVAGCGPAGVGADRRFCPRHLHPAPAEGPRRPHRHGRFWHRLLFAVVSTVLPLRQDQDRPLLHHESRRESAIGDDRAPSSASRVPSTYR